KEIALDMAPNSFDDQYKSCRTKMEKKLPLLNRTEMSRNDLYAEAWAKATAKWHSQVFPGTPLRKDQAIAVLAYTLQGQMYRNFNVAVREAGSSPQEYQDNFHFKALHFLLLTTALSDLRKAHHQGTCLHVFRGVQGIHFTAKPGDIIRFGQFTSSSLKREVTQTYGQDTLFEVDTCYGALIRNFSFNPGEEEVLIPPFETFEVTSVTHEENRPHIHLHSQGVKSNYECEWLR
ncbi:Erythroblast NAD(P)(+)--arginine ADP-ribosyltransferase, partial [Acanthisitta chloris]